MPSLSKTFTRLTDCIKATQQLLPKGASITISHTDVVAQSGSEAFRLSDNPYELQADLEAFTRIASRRIPNAEVR